MIVTFVFVKLGLIPIVFAEWFSNWFDSEPIHLLGPNCNVFVSSKQNIMNIEYMNIMKSIEELSISWSFYSNSLKVTYARRLHLITLVTGILNITFQ